MNKNIVYSLHLQFRLGFRQIARNLPKNIYLTAKERYFDKETQKFIAIKKVKFKNKLREMAVSYEESAERITLITIHPLKLLQKSNRIKAERWKKI